MEPAHDTPRGSPPTPFTLRAWWLLAVLMAAAAPATWRLVPGYLAWSYTAGITLVAFALSALPFFARAAAGAQAEPEPPAPGAASRPHPAEALLLLPVVAFGAAQLGLLRGDMAFTGNELHLLAPRDTPAWQVYVYDKGLPSLVHGPLHLLSRAVGGLPLLLGAHAALFGGFVWLVWRAVRARAGAATALGLAAMVALSEPTLYQFTELRSYATYLTLCALGALGVFQPRRRDAWVYLAFGLASLDAPIAILPLGGYALGRLVERPDALREAVFGPLRGGHSGAPLIRALLLFGPVFTAFLSQVLQVQGGQQGKPAAFGSAGAAVLVATGLVLALAGLRTRRGAPTALPGAVALLAAAALTATGLLRDAPKYTLYFLPVLLPAITGSLMALSARLRLPALAPALAGALIAASALTLDTDTRRPFARLLEGHLDPAPLLAFAAITAPILALLSLALPTTASRLPRALRVAGSTVALLAAAAFVSAQHERLGWTRTVERAHRDVGRAAAQAALASTDQRPICTLTTPVYQLVAGGWLHDATPHGAPLRAPGTAHPHETIHPSPTFGCPAEPPVTTIGLAWDQAGTYDAPPPGCEVVHLAESSRLGLWTLLCEEQPETHPGRLPGDRRERR